MIIIRTVFRLKFGKAKEAIELLKEGKKIAAEQGIKFGRTLTDITGPSYTIVFENEAESLADYENESGRIFSNDEWKKWYQKFIPHIESSYRNIFRVIET
ncbi:MAG TPA: hypothetical protein PKA90_10590 [Ignavibacteria bacterium]|nr:hypothetical protein [Ignavibacteria bacterium]HMR40864.1 hypothetical protein [Ignavibacteria bacterium]